MIRSILYTLLYVAAFFVLFIVGCKEQEKSSDVVTEPMVEEITDADFKTLWEKVDVLWEKRDPALIHTVFADDFVRISPGGTSSNAEELTNEFSIINKAYPDMVLHLNRYDITGNMVITHWLVDGTFTGELIGIKGNDKPFKDLSGITVFTIKEGKVVRDDSSWNTLELFLQTGYDIVETPVKSD
ncbi:ester cyclase [Snuella sedimenti]|uniref:Ester cyclase n=1 Tax=Snuella sedimenti TaxID=2798802 RepID=A0A8J7LZ79_9FLAO|nr:ester cyclase [Snuella sedimenti]MBJ6369791.1 ester cyclase [Snuella sedimenti]